MDKTVMPTTGTPPHSTSSFRACCGIDRDQPPQVDVGNEAEHDENWSAKPSAHDSERNGYAWGEKPEGVESEWDGTAWRKNPAPGRYEWRGNRWRRVFPVWQKALGGLTAPGLVAAAVVIAWPEPHPPSTVTTTIDVGDAPNDAAALPDGSEVYITNVGDDSVSVIGR